MDINTSKNNFTDNTINSIYSKIEIMEYTNIGNYGEFDKSYF